MPSFLAWALVISTVIVGGDTHAVHYASSVWSYTTTDAPQVTGIYHDTVIVGFYGLYHNGHTDVRTEGLDASTGKLLWRRKNAAPARGGAPFLLFGRTVERIDVRTGKQMWRSAKLCDTDASSTTAALLGERVYIGCASGDMFALQSSTGRVLASAQPITMHIVDIVPLALGTLRVSGTDADSSRSAIVDEKTLSTILAEAPDLSFLGYDGGTILTADTCCRGQHEDNWPAKIRRFSRLTGKQLSSADLHPYQPSLPMDKSQPGGGTLVLAGQDFTSRRILHFFNIDIRKLSARPRILYDNLVGGTSSVIENRYFVLRNAAGRVSLFDTRSGRIAWSDDSETGAVSSGLQSLEQSLGLATAKTASSRNRSSERHDDVADQRHCWLIQASTERLVLTYCPGPGGTGPVRPSLSADVQTTELS